MKGRRDAHPTNWYSIGFQSRPKKAGQAADPTARYRNLKKRNGLGYLLNLMEGKMSLIKEIWLFCTTRPNVPGSNSNSTKMELEISSQGQIVKRKMGNLAGDQFEPNRADVFHWDLSNENIDDELILPNEVRVTNPTMDGWLPESFWLISRNHQGKLKLLVANTDWPNKWFKADGPAPGEFAPSWPIDQTT
jgi:hypothetical protein